jgi:hypothetical protein
MVGDLTPKLCALKATFGFSNMAKKFSSMAERWPVAARMSRQVKLFGPRAMSPETAGHDADYGEIRRFPTRENALRFLSANE